MTERFNSDEAYSATYLGVSNEDVEKAGHWALDSIHLKSYSQAAQALRRKAYLKTPPLMFSCNSRAPSYHADVALVEGKLVSSQPDSQETVVLDELDDNGNLKKRLLYESLLAKHIVEEGQAYWRPSYDKILTIHMQDFDEKVKNAHQYPYYFKTILKALKVMGYTHNENDFDGMRMSMQEIFFDKFDILKIGQWFFEITMHDLGPDQFEEIHFSTQGSFTPSAGNWLNFWQPNRLKDHYPEMTECAGDVSTNVETRAQFFWRLGPGIFLRDWIRGRQLKACGEEITSDMYSSVIGTGTEDFGRAYPELASTEEHFAAKYRFIRKPEHPIAQMMSDFGGNLIAGPSGTICRNLFLILPLWERGLLTDDDVRAYLMGITAQMIYEGHHSYMEALVMVMHDVPYLYQFNETHDFLHDPINAFESLLTDAYKASGSYQQFKARHAPFFDEPYQSCRLAG